MITGNIYIYIDFINNLFDRFFIKNFYNFQFYIKEENNLVNSVKYASRTRIKKLITNYTSINKKESLISSIIRFQNK